MLADRAAFARLVSEPGVTTVIDPNRLQDAEVRKRERFSGALLIEAVATITTVMLSIGEGERSPTSHADIGIYPFGRLEGRQVSFHNLQTLLCR